MLAVGREGHVAGAERAARADLGGFLAEQRGPDAQLALALQRDRLEVDPADQDEVAVQRLDLVGGQLQRVVGVLDPLALGGQQLDQFRLMPPARTRSGSGGSVARRH